MIYHYCRVSTKEQHLDRQYTALSAYKTADRVFADKASGKDFLREQYKLLKATVHDGDEVIIKELDRLGRNKDEVKRELQWFKEHGVTVRILDIPTTLIDFGDQGWIQDMINNIIVEVMGAVAQNEREHIKQRQREGIDAYLAKGGRMGRPRAEVDEVEFQKFLQKQKAGEMTVGQCCEQLGITTATWYRRAKVVA